ncbi:ABC transporter substrate-binding protein [Rhizobium sp. C4]|uniref:ABC transporter substrate-binding protein n=1 Tax=Rhizobium sp. C4 TaxID=1349800 RepID=UPI001E5C528B|nr:ABC transporter substrate-binding protein [Rhizobium sp. C4]MCD2171662.1 ABC transporter substrate-binding protein [Rhizobium sp. C4]
MTKLLLTTAALLSLLSAGLAEAKGLTIGVVAPDDGPFAVLGKQIMAGAKAQAEAAGNRILAVPESCAPESGVDVASRLIAGGASVAIGFLCADSLIGSAQALKDASIPAITLSARSKVLFEDAVKHGWPIYSLSSRPGEEASATAGFIAGAWAGSAIALLDDGTLNSHELAANIRLELEAKGIKPVLAEAFRPSLDNQKILVRRLQKAGVSAVYVAGARSDIAVIARDAAGTGISFMGGDQLLAADEGVALPDGVLAAIPVRWGEQPEASAIVHALGEQNIVAEGYVLPAHAAAQIVEKAEAMISDKQDLAASIAGGSFDTAIGTVTFAKDHFRAENIYRLMAWRNGAFQQPVPPASQTPTKQGQTQ